MAMQTSPDAPVPIGLLWHSLDSGNLGMGALTIGNTRLIAEAMAKFGRTPSFHILGGRGEIDYFAEVPHPVDFTNIGWRSMLTPGSPFHAKLASCAATFDIGGGDSFSDIYRWKRYGLIVGSKIAAARTGKPLVLSPQTIGPFLSPHGKLVGSLGLRAADFIVTRDRPSYDLLVDAGYKAKSALSTDVAFKLPFVAAADKLDRDLATGPVKVGLNVSALMYRRDKAEGDKIALAVDYAKLTDRMLARLFADPRIEVHMIPHVLTPTMANEDDYWVAERLKERYPQLVLGRAFTSPSDAKTTIANLDLLIGARMHATIAGLSSGTATLPMGYSRKFSGLFGSLGYPYLADLTSMDEDRIMAELETVLADLPGVTAAARTAAAKADIILESYTNYLESFFEKLFAADA